MRLLFPRSLNKTKESRIFAEPSRAALYRRDKDKCCGFSSCHFYLVNGELLSPENFLDSQREDTSTMHGL